MVQECRGTVKYHNVCLIVPANCFDATRIGSKNTNSTYIGALKSEMLSTSGYLEISGTYPVKGAFVSADVFHTLPCNLGISVVLQFPDMTTPRFRQQQDVQQEATQGEEQ